MSTLALVHTVHSIIPEFERLCAQYLPGIRTAHFLDESTLRDAIKRGNADAQILQRVCRLICLAQQGGADAILVTCSSIGGSVAPARQLVSVPVHRIDAPMAAQAVRRGGRIAVAATVASTLDPTVALIREKAKGKSLRIQTALFADAFQARLNGDGERHDRILEKGFSALLRTCDTLVLAQASMARVARKIALPKGVKLLSSPVSGVRQMRRFLPR